MLTQAIRNNVFYNKPNHLISFTYTDNGIGFDWMKIQKERKGLGLMNIQQRVQIMKGEIEIKSEPQKE
jgi:two-component system sensor histidine kinase NreB